MLPNTLASASPAFLVGRGALNHARLKMTFEVFCRNRGRLLCVGLALSSQESVAALAEGKKSLS